MIAEHEKGRMTKVIHTRSGSQRVLHLKAISEWPGHEEASHAPTAA